MLRQHWADQQTRDRANVVLMLSQRRRRWPNIKTLLSHHLLVPDQLMGHASKNRDIKHWQSAVLTLAQDISCRPNIDSAFDLHKGLAGISIGTE